MTCSICRQSKAIDKGRALDGRRAYRCQLCKSIWTYGTQNREKRYSPQRNGFQFSNTGADRQIEVTVRKDRDMLQGSLIIDYN